MSNSLLTLLLLPCVVATAAEEIPFPVERSTILREGGVVYVVEGRRKIGWGTEISVQKDVHIIGRGKSAVIEVEGDLEVHGVGAREVIFENLVIEPSPKFQKIRLDMAIFRANAGIRTARSQPVCGLLEVENCKFHPGSPLEVELADGEAKLIASAFREPVRIRGVPGDPANGSPLRVTIQSCNTILLESGGFNGGLFLEGVRDATVRVSCLGGQKSEFRDCRALTFDGNKVTSDALLLVQTEAGRFKDTTLLKCDIYSKALVLHAPAGKAKEKVPLDKCWFRGVTKADEILDKVIRDGRKDPTSGVFAEFRKINERALELAGVLER